MHFTLNLNFKMAQSSARSSYHDKDSFVIFNFISITELQRTKITFTD